VTGKVLVTTALEDTWPPENHPVLFLGEWCRLYSRKFIWKELDAEILQYPWDDRNLPEVIEARDNFKRKYVFSDNRPLDKLAEVFKAF